MNQRTIPRTTGKDAGLLERSVVIVRIAASVQTQDFAFRNYLELRRPRLFLL
jgi:hypothetical protein